MLTPEQIQFYKDNGYLLAEKVFAPEEIDECVRETDAMFERTQQQGRRLEATCLVFTTCSIIPPCLRECWSIQSWRESSPI